MWTVTGVRPFSEANPAFIPGHFPTRCTWADQMWQIPLWNSYERSLQVVSQAAKALEPFCPLPAKSSTIASIFGGRRNCNQSQQSTSSVYLFQNRSQRWTFPMEAVALWVNRKPNKESDFPVTGSQKVLFWYERTIISFHFWTNLICRKYFRIQVNLAKVWVWTGVYSWPRVSELPPDHVNRLLFERLFSVLGLNWCIQNVALNHQKPLARFDIMKLRLYLSPVTLGLNLFLISYP